jgi:hypothetical protein
MRRAKHVFGLPAISLTDIDELIFYFDFAGKAIVKSSLRRSEFQ